MSSKKKVVGAEELSPEITALLLAKVALRRLQTLHAHIADDVQVQKTLIAIDKVLDRKG